MKKAILLLVSLFFLVSITTISARAQEKIDPILEFKLEVIRLINLEREKEKLPLLLSEKEILFTLADIRAKESSNKFSHTRPNGTRCFTIFKENSLKYKAAGENLAYGFNTPEKIVKAWMNSPLHRANILEQKNLPISLVILDQMEQDVLRFLKRTL